jgi:hypothetical protein
MRKRVIMVVSILSFLFGVDITASCLLGVGDVHLRDSRMMHLESLATYLVAGYVYADEGTRQRGPGKETGSDNNQGERTRGNPEKDGKEKKDKKRKDKGKGPSLPALPMVSSIVLGLLGIGAGRFLLRKGR